MKQYYRYTIHFNQHSGTGFVEFDGFSYLYDHSEGVWRFMSDNNRELVAQGSEVVYFTAEPLVQLPAAASV